MSKKEIKEFISLLEEMKQAFIELEKQHKIFKNQRKKLDKRTNQILYQLKNIIEND